MPPAGTTIAYQPIFDLRTGRAVRVEALLALPSWTDGSRSPADYVRELGVTDVVEFGRWVTRQAAHDLDQMRRRAGEGVGLSISVDPREAAVPAWADEVLRCLADAHLRPPHLTVELTNGAPFTAGPALDGLHRLRLLGAGIALKGVGAGINPLELLQRLPITELKIDRRFVGRLAQDPAGDVSAADAIARGLLTMARELSLTVVAEGIETEEQLMLLREMGVDYGQGYHFAPPSSLEDVVELLAVGDRNPAAVDLIRVMFLSGSSQATIAAALNNQGYRRDNGQRWHRESVARAIDETVLRRRRRRRDGE